MTKVAQQKLDDIGNPKHKDKSSSEEDEEEYEEYSDQQREIAALQEKFFYSPRYSDDLHEYRHVALPREYYNNYVPEDMKGRLLTEEEWRSIGIQQSLGWTHYELHRPEPHIFMFRRDK